MQKTDNEKKEIVKTANEKEAPVTKVKVKADKVLPGGVFKPVYESQIVDKATLEEEGTAGIFKSTSGWKDRKYYCLHNEAASGTVVKITNIENGKFVYAKVLDVIPDLRQNYGQAVIVSNSAAEELGVAENNFNCRISYFK